MHLLLLLDCLRPNATSAYAFIQLAGLTAVSNLVNFRTVVIGGPRTYTESLLICDCVEKEKLEMEDTTVPYRMVVTVELEHKWDDERGQKLQWKLAITNVRKTNLLCITYTCLWHMFGARIKTAKFPGICFSN